jgi:hypothetical protein
LQGDDLTIEGNILDKPASYKMYKLYILPCSLADQTQCETDPNVLTKLKMMVANPKMEMDFSNFEQPFIKKSFMNPS